MKRFWDKVSKTNGCWQWNAYKIPSGYGKFRFRGEARLAHRVAYVLTHGQIPVGKHVCHRCDNPACVNPAHLFLSDQHGNMQDKTVKSRAGKKLNVDSVLAIRSMAGKHNYTALGKMFGVSDVTIEKVISRKTWRYI